MLTHASPGLNASCYYDPAFYQRELRHIWWQDWICIARIDEWAAVGDYRRFDIGGQQFLVLLDEAGVLRGFYNTCRHRGSMLAEAASGCFAQQRIVCPYHAWCYSLEGKLERTPRRAETADFRMSDYSLYPVAVDTWGGFVFVCLADTPALTLDEALGEEAARLESWPLARLALAHRAVHEIDCNWKVFWENYLECYHCPGAHPDLCRLVPVYGQGLVTAADLPASAAPPATAAGSPLRDGAVTWSNDGTTPLPWFAGLTPQEQAAGMTFSTFPPTMFVVAHVDYVRSVHVMPLGPERTRLTVNWMLLPETLAAGGVDLERLTAFGNQVVMEDARVCELNQQGLHCRRHERGVLVAQEYDVLAFDNWVLDRIGEPAIS